MKGGHLEDMNFVDTHVHFYDMQHQDLVYAHWSPDVDHPTLGTQKSRSSFVPQISV